MTDDLREKLRLKELLSLPGGKHLTTAIAVAIVLVAIILAFRLDDVMGPVGMDFKFRRPGPAVAAEP